MKRKIKAVFIDIDGTLYSHTSSSIPDASLRVIEEARAKGILVIAATGRHMGEIAQLGIDIHLDGWITLNGALCLDENGAFFTDPLDGDDLKQLLKCLSENPFPCQFMEQDLMYINLMDEEVKRHLDAIHTPYPEILDPVRSLSNDTYMIIPWVSENVWEKTASKMKHIKYTRWNDLAADVMSDVCGKKRGVLAACAHYGIDPVDTMAIGDGPNDLELFEACGISAAMGNALESVKSAADIITDGIDEGGFEKIFKEYILEEGETT